MSRWRKKPVVVEAVQWTPLLKSDSTAWPPCISKWLPPRFDSNGDLVVYERAGWTLCRVGDWIVVEPDGGPLVVRDDIFRETYEPVEEPTP